MKALMPDLPPDVLQVRGVKLKFNAFDERCLQKWQAAGAQVEAKYPGAMDLGVDPAAMLRLPAGGDTAAKMADGTAAFCELFDGVFGEGTSAQLFGGDPYYGLCLEVYYELLAAIDRQGQQYGRRVSKITADMTPVGPRGAVQ